MLRVDSSCPCTSSAPAPAACRSSAPRARLCRPVTSPRCSPLRCAHPAPQPEIMSTFPADVAAAARAVAARRLILPLCQLGAGSRRAPSSRAACAPLSPRDITSLLGLCDAHTPRHSPRSCRPFLPTSPLPPAPLLRVDSSCPFASSAPAPAACRASAPRARLCRPVTSPRCSPLRCAHPAPQPEIMSTFPADVAAAARAIAARRLFLPLCQLGAGSRRAPSSRAARAPLSPRDITSLLASAMRTPRATARDHVGLSCRRRRCRPRRCCATTLLWPLCQLGAGSRRVPI